MVLEFYRTRFSSMIYASMWRRRKIILFIFASRRKQNLDIEADRMFVRERCYSKATSCWLKLFGYKRVVKGEVGRIWTVIASKVLGEFRLSCGLEITNFSLDSSKGWNVEILIDWPKVGTRSNVFRVYEM